jgi:uncharacterized cupredoxin-like copper-binding protein
MRRFAPLLLALAGCSTPSPRNLQGPAPVGAVDWQQPRAVQVELNEFQFRPAELQFTRGAPISLVLVNGGRFEHTFTAPAFFAEARPRPGTALPPDGSVTLKPGERRNVELVPTRAGAYDLACTEPLHAMMGMRGTIRVSG